MRKPAHVACLLASFNVRPAQTGVLCTALEDAVPGQRQWRGPESNSSNIRLKASPFSEVSPRTLWSGFALEVAGRRLYFAGDSAFHPEFARIGAQYGPFDLVMMPIGAYDPRWFMHVVHVDPEEAVYAYRDLTAPNAGAPAPLMLALHWGTFRLTDEPMDEPPARARTAWREHGLDESRLWIAKFGETRTW